MAKHIKLGLLPPDDPIYTGGLLVVGGTPLISLKSDPSPQEILDKISKYIDQNTSKTPVDD